MVNINNIDKDAFRDTWDEILSIMASMDADKNALKQLKAELGSIIGANNAKETNALIKALLKKQKDAEFYDSEAVDAATEVWNGIIEDFRTPQADWDISEVRGN